MTFKKDFKQGLYNYLHVSSPCSNETISSIEIKDVSNSYQFHNYISLAKFLTAQLTQYVIIRFSPYVMKLRFVEMADWQYVVLANDCDGLGVDKGFTNVKKSSQEQFVLLSINDLLLLTKLPEDTFGYNFSNCSIFGLSDNRLPSLKKFIQSDNPPVLSEFIQKAELFIHINCGKAIGYYNLLLLKCTEDIEQNLYTFQTIIDPNN